jgi:transketolase
MNTTPLKTMRDAFIEQIYDRMHNNEDIFFLTADFGAPSLDKIREKFKDRFINVGIAEQNLINIATGLALEGYTVYAYAIAPFITMRAYEQIRSNLSISSQIRPVNVNLIGVGAGISYDVSGPTHHCLEDISIMRLLPNIMVFSPSDWKLAEGFIDYSINVKSPKYIRFDSKPVTQIYSNTHNFDFESGFYELIKGEKVCIVSTGYMTHLALKAAIELHNVGVIDMFILKPVNDELLFGALRKYEYIITVEEAFINRSGLDSLVLNVLNKYQSNIKLKKLGFDDRYVFELGDRNYLHRINNLDKESIIRTVQECYR